MSDRTIRIGTRRSQLARWQANYIRDLLATHHPDYTFELAFIVTQGDRILDKPLVEIGGKGLFTLELEAALIEGEVDMAVHSLKDLPTDMDPAFTLGAWPERVNPFDAFISRAGHTLDQMPEGATIGTSSLRRGAQLRAHRPDLAIKSIRGNIDTRIAKAMDPDGPYDAIVLAVAGLERLALTEHIAEMFVPAVMLPAPAQGALGLQCRAGDETMLGLLEAINHPATEAAVTAERAFLGTLEAGCRLPVSAYGTVENGVTTLRGRVSAVDGSRTIEVEGTGKDVAVLGVKLAHQAIGQGADVLIAEVKEEMEK